MCALDIVRTYGVPQNMITLYTYGQPRTVNTVLSDYIFSWIPNYVRVVHYDDMVAHLPVGQGYRHAGNEVWYKNSKHDGIVYECPNYAFQDENSKCSNSLTLNSGISAHRKYMGIGVAQ